MTDKQAVYWIEEIKRELKTRRYPKYQDEVYEALDMAIAKLNTPDSTYAWQDSVPNVDNDFGDYPYTCPNCHTAQRYKSKYCPECGVKILMLCEDTENDKRTSNH